MNPALYLLALLAVASLIAIALNTLTIAVSLENQRIQRQNEMADHWEFPDTSEFERVLTGYDLAVPGSDRTVATLWSPDLIDVPDWRKALPARSSS